MRITILSMNFWPEETGTGPVIEKLVEDLRGQGHEVKVVASVPYYPRRVVPPEYRGKLIVKEDFQGTPVYRTWIYVSDERTALRKILLHLSFTVSCVVGLIRAGRPDVLISISPPLFVPTVAGIASRIWRCKHVLRLEDMLPDAAIIYGLIRNKWLRRVLEAVERINYWLSDSIVAICNGFARNLQKKRVDMGKVAIIPHYVAPASENTSGNSFREKLNLGHGTFLAQYAGNIGHSQGLEVILEAAKLLRREGRVRFMIVGEGVAKRRLEEISRKEQLRNVMFLPVQPAEKLDELLWAADVCLVTQKANVLDINVPSKIFNIMAHARPMIAAVNPHSDAASIVAASGAGVVIPPGEGDQLAREVMGMVELEDRGRGYGRAGYEFASREYSRLASVKKYESLLTGLVA